MSRVYIDAELAPGAEIALDKPRAHYLRNVLRLKPGAAFFLFNGREAIDYRARLRLEGKKAFARIGAASRLQTESAIDSEIIQGLGRSDHVDWAIQKTTELGVKRIAIFNAEYSQSPLKSAQLEKKLDHWRGVAISACEQCGRGIVPRIEFHATLRQAISASTAELRLLLDFTGRGLQQHLAPPRTSVSLLLGPEGGLNPDEIELAEAAGFTRASLGPRVLRTETAATAALAIILSCLEDYC